MADYHLFPILQKFDRLTWRADDPNLGECRCPGHEDSTNSLHVTIKHCADGQTRLMLTCKAGCQNGDILRVMGEGFSSLFPDRTRQGNRNPSTSSAGKVRSSSARPAAAASVAVQSHDDDQETKKRKFIRAYDYRDSSGVVQHQTVRWEPKQFTQRRRVHSASPVTVSGKEYVPFRDPYNNYWINTLKGIEPLIYDLPRILAAPIDKVIFLCEGEKDVENLKAKFKLYATTVPMGSGKWRKSYGSYFRGRRVIIIPDTDKPRVGQTDPAANAGYDGARRIAAELVEICHEVRICYLPNLFNFTPKWDLTDWLEAGGTKAKFIEACNLAPVLSVGHPGLIPAGESPASFPAEEEEDFQDQDSNQDQDSTPSKAILLPVVFSKSDPELNGKFVKLDKFGKPIRGQITSVIETDEKYEAIGMREIIDNIYRICDGWPKRVGKSLFYCDREDPIDPNFFPVQWLESTAGLFGWAGKYSGMPIYFPAGGGASKEEIFTELRTKDAQCFDSLEQYPHQPRIPGVYYACKDQDKWVSEKPGILLELVARFEPAEPVDYDLILAFLMTLVWGGGGGRRPIFLITSESGRGAGKTTFATMASSLVGGCLQISSHADDDVVRQRLLSPEGMSKRCVLYDNVKSHKFSSPDFESMATAQNISGKKMYVGEASRANLITYIVTMNGPSLSTDLAQRSVTIKLRKAKHDGTWLQDTMEFIEKHKISILSELIALLQAPPVKLEKYTRWGDWEQNVLCRLESAALCQAAIVARQTDNDAEQGECGLILEYFERQLIKNQCRPESDKTLIPSGVAAEWMNSALGERHSKNSACKMLHQRINEGRLPTIFATDNGGERVDGSTQKTRGFWWIPERWVEGDNVIKPGGLATFDVDDFVNY